MRTPGIWVIVKQLKVGKLRKRKKVLCNYKELGEILHNLKYNNNITIAMEICGM